MKRILLITENFPFFPGEQFLEDEVLYWDKLTSYGQLTILPINAVGKPRNISNNIRLESGLNNGVKQKKMFFAVMAIFKRIFWNEVVYLLAVRKFSFGRLLVGAISVSKVFLYRKLLSERLVNLGWFDVVYCYWNTEVCYAAVDLRNSGLMGKVVSRVHGHDLYEERKKHKYMPLKRQYLSKIDRIYALSREAKEYLISNYGAADDIIEIMPLGVPVPKLKPHFQDSGDFHVLSVSFCTKVKRLDKLIQALAIVAEDNSNVFIHWTHIGNGPLENEYKALARKLLSDSKNLSYKFAGFCDNEYVKSFCVDHKVGCFVNASESEGIPVSIMECMACGVAAIAPDVGGISELVTNDTGILMSREASIHEIVFSLLRMITMNSLDNETMRCNARKLILNKYNADINYPGFIRGLIT